MATACYSCSHSSSGLRHLTPSPRTALAGRRHQKAAWSSNSCACAPIRAASSTETARRGTKPAKGGARCERAFSTPEKSVASTDNVGGDTAKAETSHSGGSWPESALPALAAITRLLQRTMGGACPADAHEPVFAPLFHSVTVPEISPAAYLEEYVLSQGLLHKEGLLEPLLLHMVVLIDRLLLNHASRGLHLCVSNAHRLLLVAALLASKVLDDESYNNAYWARVGGVSLSHLNDLEVLACELLEFRVSVSAEELQLTRTTLLTM